MDVVREISRLNRWLGSIVSPQALSETSSGAPQRVDVRVLSVSGAELAQLSLPAAEKVKAVKKHLQAHGHTNRRPPACQRLMVGTRLLSDDESLAGLPTPAVMTLILLMFDPQRNDSLIHAARSGSLAALEAALSGLADPNHKCRESRQTGLHLLASQGHLDAVALMCDSGANPAAMREDDATPLFNAALAGHVPVVEYLLRKAPETVNYPRRSRATPLFVAAQMGHHEVARLLCARGGDPNLARGDGATPLFVASQNGHVEVVKHLCRHDAELNTAMRDGATPLFVAAQNGHLSTVQELCKHGADVDKPRADLSTPLFISCQRGHVSIVRFLCDAGADACLMRSGGAGPVHILAQKGNVKALRIILEAGADVNAKMADGAAALSIAAQHGNVEAVQFLLNAGADVDAARADGATALFMATHHQHMDAANLLLKVGADREKATEEGTMPLQAARTHAHLVALLSEGSKSPDAITAKNSSPTSRPKFPLRWPRPLPEVVG